MDMGYQAVRAFGRSVAQRPHPLYHL